MRVVVTGGRDFTDTRSAFAALDALHARRPITVLISGKCKTGLDARAEAWARQLGIPVDPYPAPWDDIDYPDAVVRYRRDGTAYDANAGPRRNQQMIDEGKPDYALVFRGRGGTADMRRRIVAAGIEFEDVE